MKLELQSAIEDEIESRARLGKVWKPLDVSEMLALLPEQHGDPEDYELREYEENVVWPLVTGHVLEPTGIPYSDNWIVGPYLPTPRTFLLTHAAIAARDAG
jgi:hypothetical protein